MAEKQEILVANLTLDTYQKNNIPPLVIPQGDYGARVIRVRITEQGRPVTVTPSEAASIVAERNGDGESKAFSGTVNEDGTVNVPVTQWMLDLPDDDVICHVVITGNDYQYSTTEFLIEPKKKANPTEIAKDDPRQDIVTEILANESARQAAEATRIANETGREAAEDAREEAEAKRLQDEELRTANEALRVTAESEREAAEDQRAAAESERAIAEDGRKKEIETLDQRVSKTEKRLTNIEQGVMADSFEVDDSVAYVKDVPTNALPYAAISKVGGMTYKDGDVLRSAPVTDVESVGMNLFDINAPHTVVPGGTYKYNLYGKPNTRYTFSTNVPEGQPANIYANGGSTYENGVHEGRSITTTTDEHGKMYCEVRYEESGTGIDAYTGLLNGVYWLQIVEGSTARPYTPYVKQTLPIPAEVRPAHGINDDVYDYLDFGEQESVERVGVVDMGTLNWEYGNLFGTGVSCFYSTEISDAKFASAYEIATVLCPLYNPTTPNSIAQTGETGIALFDAIGAVVIYDTNYTDAATFKSAMAGVMLYYELAEPIVTDISDILSSDNFIGVEGSGTITMVNEHKFAVPSEIIYQVKGVSV